MPQEFGRKFGHIISSLRDDISGLEEDLEKGFSTMHQLARDVDTNIDILDDRLGRLELANGLQRRKMAQMTNWIWNLQSLAGSNKLNNMDQT